MWLQRNWTKSAWVRKHITVRIVAKLIAEKLNKDQWNFHKSSLMNFFLFLAIYSGLFQALWPCSACVQWGTACAAVQEDVWCAASWGTGETRPADVRQPRQLQSDVRVQLFRLGWSHSTGHVCWAYCLKYMTLHYIVVMNHSACVYMCFWHGVGVSGPLPFLGVLVP